MPKLKPATQARRREHILDAAELCFARNGFHRTTMQDICKEAGVSPGAVYVYFTSKEELIAGITERDRAKLQRELAGIAAAPDLLAALADLAETYTIDEPRHKRVLCLEIGAESTRNAAVGDIFRAVDRFVLDSFEQLFDRAQRDGKIAPSVDAATLAQVVALIGDGVLWRRAVDPSFDPEAIIPVLTRLVALFLNPVATEELPASSSPKRVLDSAKSRS